MTDLILKGRDYLSLPSDPDTYLVAPLLPSGGTMMLYGDPKVGKSYAALQLALALQSGGSWLGFEIPHPSRPVYIQLDTPRSLWGLRLRQLAGVGVVGIDDLLLADRGTLNTWPFDILSPSHQNLLKGALEPLSPDVVIIDTLREVHSGDENDSTIMKSVLSSLVGCVQPAALILIHHSKKPAPDREPDLINDMRGGYIAGAMDAIVRFTRRGVHYVGRSIEPGSVITRRGDDGFWVEDDPMFRVLLEAAISNTSLASLTDKAEQLSMLAGKDLDSCRAALRKAGVQG